MNLDVERYKICFECFRERKHSGGFLTIAFWIRDTLETDIAKHRKWRNRVNFYTEPYASADELCHDCPYVLEHTVLKRKLK